MATAARETVRVDHPPPDIEAVQIIRTEVELRAVQSEWEEFLERDAGAHTAREQPLFMMRSTAAEQKGMQPYVVIIRDNGIQCIAPFYLHRRSIPLRFGPIGIPMPQAKLLRLVGERLVHRKGSSEAGNIQRILRALKHHTNEFDAIWLPELDMPGDLWDFFEKDRSRAGFRLIRLSPNAETVQQINLPASFEEYLSGFKGEDRRNRKRALRKLDGAGKIEMTEYSTRNDMKGFFATANVIRNRSWKAKEFGPDRYVGEELLTFYEEVAGRGWVRNYILTLDQRPIAFLITYGSGNTYLFAEWGFDEEFRSLSPGVGLILKTLRRLCEEGRSGVRVMLLPTDSRMKRSLGNSTYDITNAVLVSNRSLKGRMTFGFHRFVAYQHKRVVTAIRRLRGRQAE